jgi:small subunit ribosomal protein S1
VHVSELAERHVEIPEQVVQVNDDVMVKIIDIDLERRRISLSLKQANEGVDAGADDFDPTLYGMAASYDDQGNYLYPEGFDPETGEWLPGYEEQRHAWEQQYAEAHARWEAHKKQVEDAESGESAPTAAPTTYSSSSESSVPAAPTAPEGSLASDEALQKLREKLTGGS